MRLSISVAAGAALCVAAVASGTVVREQNFERFVLGSYINDGSEYSKYISQKYGKSSGYLHTLPADLDRSYEPFQGLAADLISGSIRITIDLGRDTGFNLPISFHFMFYSGSDASPVKQFELFQKAPVNTNGDGIRVAFQRTLTRAELDLLASGAGAPTGTFFCEVFSSNFSFTGKVEAKLITEAVPGPGGALAMTIFAMGGLARRRRAA